MHRSIFTFFVAVSLGALTTAQDAKPRRAVLVTGASSGIGRKATEVLAQNGFHVYAGARKKEDLDALNALDHVEAIRLDVTVQTEIDAAVATVRERGRGLYGLINNAGVAVLAPLIELQEKDLAFQLDVNLYGPYRVTKAFAPLLIESKGRVMTTGSLSGTATWTFGGPYCISKHGVEAFTDVLAAELRPFGVAVSVIEPGNYKSEIMTSMRERLVANGYTTEGSRYRDRMDGLLERPTDRSQYQEPDDVAAAFVEALTVEQPRRRYLVVPNRGEAMLTLRAAMQRVVQLNEGQKFQLERDELVRMLDEALGKPR